MLFVWFQAWKRGPAKAFLWNSARDYVIYIVVGRIVFLKGDLAVAAI